MEHWTYTLIFIFTILVIMRNIFLIVVKMFDSELNSYVLQPKELILLGMSVSFFITYLIY